MKSKKRKSEDELMYQDFKEKIERFFTPSEIQEMLTNSRLIFDNRNKKNKSKQKNQ